MKLSQCPQYIIKNKTPKLIASFELPDTLIPKKPNKYISFKICRFNRSNPRPVFTKKRMKKKLTKISSDHKCHKFSELRMYVE